MAFSPAFLDELNARNPIEDVVGQYVALTRRGNNLFGLCPFHSEKTPSFHVYPDTQSFYCFGCGAGGDVITAPSASSWRSRTSVIRMRCVFWQSAPGLRCRRTANISRSTS